MHVFAYIVLSSSYTCAYIKLQKVCFKMYLVSYEMSCVLKSSVLCNYAKTKAQISCTVTTQLISAFVFATWIVQSLYFLNPKFQTSSLFCGCAAWFMSELFGNSEDRFSHDTAQMLNCSDLVQRSLLRSDI